MISGIPENCSKLFSLLLVFYEGHHKLFEAG